MRPELYMTTAIGPEMVKLRREQLQILFGKVGSFYPLGENFRLTASVKETSTSKLNAEAPRAKDRIFR